ncbi:MAG: 4Fe-4S binding protein [Methanomassiliicoccales archaeon]|jgi:ferredoxin
MANGKYILEFSPDLVKEPIIYVLTRDLGVKLNILRADITEHGGEMLLEMSGENKEKALVHLRSLGVKVRELNSLINRDEKRCSNCGMCVSICPFNSYELDPKDYLVVFHNDRCIGCGMCIDACPTVALSLIDGN